MRSSSARSSFSSGRPSGRRSSRAASVGPGGGAGAALSSLMPRICRHPALLARRVREEPEFQRRGGEHLRASHPAAIAAPDHRRAKLSMRGGTCGGATPRLHQPASVPGNTSTSHGASMRPPHRETFSSEHAANVARGWNAVRGEEARVAAVHSTDRAHRPEVLYRRASAGAPSSRGAFSDTVAPVATTPDADKTRARPSRSLRGRLTVRPR
jgi:hypothetical protein